MDWHSLVLIALALGGGGLVKGITGMGMPMVAVPVMAAFIGVPHAVAVMVVPIAVTNFMQMRAYWSWRREAGFLLLFLPAGVAGIGLGTWLLVELPERALSFAVAAMIFAYILLRLVKPGMRLGAGAALWLATPAGVAAGALQGATGVAGPVVATFLNAMRLDRPPYVFAASAMFLLFALVQLPALLVAGIMTWRIMLEGALAVLPALAMMSVGGWLARFMKPQTFDRIILGLLAVIALQLLVKASA
jgi:uncharacterized membrane protein YfcA